MNPVTKIKNYFTLMEDTPSKQQLIPGLHINYSYKKLAILSFIMSILLAITGIGLTITNNNLDVYQIDYSNCNTCTDIENWNFDTKCECTLNLRIDRPLNFPVYVHYGLSNYFQNLGVFKFSKDYGQFSGAPLTQPSSLCINYRFDENDKPIAPCGDLANTKFNDTFSLSLRGFEIPIDIRNIHPKVSKAMHNPANNENLKRAFNGFAKPPYWPKNAYELDLEDSENNGFLNKQFASWMSVEQFPDFRKLYGIIDEAELRSKSYENIPAGTYQLHVKYNYPIAGARFTKSFVIGNTGLIGQRNRGLEYLTYSFLAIWLLVTFASVVMILNDKRQKAKVFGLKN